MGSIDNAYSKYCKERFSLPSDAEVASLERRIGILLPEEFRRFVLNYNGGYFEADFVGPTKGCPDDRLEVLYGIGASHPSAELASAADLAIFDDNDPPQVVPIGYTLMGNMLLILTHPEPENRGVIMLSKAWAQTYFFLAKGIEPFFNLLREPSDD